MAEIPVPPTDKTDRTRLSDSFVGFVGASDEVQGEEIAWRVAAFRAIIPAQGPIWPPQLRDSPLYDTSGRCHLCSDELVGDPLPRYRCRPCVRALWLALNPSREGEGAEQP